MAWSLQSNKETHRTKKDQFSWLMIFSIFSIFSNEFGNNNKKKGN